MASSIINKSLANDVSLIDSKLTTMFQNNVDVFSFMGNNPKGVMVYAFGTGCTNVPTGWGWFGVVTVPGNAIATNGTAIAVSHNNGTSWSPWVIIS